MNIRPENQAYLWPSPAQSRRSEPFGVARAACFEQVAGHCQLRCPALCKDLSQSEDKERYIPDTSELRSESAKNIDRSCWLNISNGVTDPRHRRRNILPPATTDQALRAARQRAVLALDCCLSITRNVHPQAWAHHVWMQAVD